jgi:mannosyltransferase
MSVHAGPRPGQRGSQLAKPRREAAVVSRHEREQSEISSGLSQKEWLVLFALCAVSAAACFMELGTRGLWLDEIGSVLAADHHGMNLWSGVTFNGGDMLLYYVLLHVFVSVFGDGQLAVRIPSALAGVALTPVIFFLSRRMFGSRTAVIATALVAVSPALVVWDQQARGYSLGTLLVASCLLALFRALEVPSTRRWCVYGLLVVLSIYTIVYAALFLVAQLLPLLFLPSVRRQAKSILLVVSVAVLAYVPLTVLMLRTGAASVLDTNGAPSIDESIKFLQEFASSIAPHFFAATAITAVITIIAVLCWIAGGAELLSRVRRAPSAEDTACLAVAVSWLFVPLSLDAICSLAYRSIYYASFLLQSVPAGAILVAFVIANLLPKVLSFSVVAALVALLLAALVPTYGISYEEWPQASRFILMASRSGDCLTVNKEFVASDLAYYFHIEGPIGLIATAYTAHDDMVRRV